MTLVTDGVSERVDDARLVEIRDAAGYQASVAERTAAENPMSRERLEAEAECDRAIESIASELIARRAAEAWIGWKPGDDAPDEGEYWVLWEGAVTKRREVRLLHVSLWNACIKAYVPQKQPPLPPPRSET